MTRAGTPNGVARRSNVSVVVHWILLPWTILMWWGIAMLAADISGPGPQGRYEWSMAIAILAAAFGLGVGLWIWILRILRRWAREQSTGFLPNWCYPLLWAFTSWLLATIGFALRSWQFNHRGS